MPMYDRLRDPQVRPSERRRTVEGLQRLRRQLKAQVPTRTIRENLLLATWNIRDLGEENKRFEENEGPGERLEESYYYMAEIIAAFDIVALQEVNTLESLEKLMDHLGPSWDFLTTDLKRGAGGNQERMTFVYDTRKVRFKNVIGQVVLDNPTHATSASGNAEAVLRGRSATAEQDGPGNGLPGSKQFARTPFYAAFQSGWFKFTMCTVHILYGDRDDTTRRVAEIDAISRFLSDRAADTGEDIILLGDFNIINRTDETFRSLTKHGWQVPLDYNTDAIENHAYDQIAFHVKAAELSEPNGGRFDFFDAVFRNEDADLYYRIAGERGRPLDPWDDTADWKDRRTTLTRQQYYETIWRTFQLSDHFPLWAELSIDSADGYLQRTKTWSRTPSFYLFDWDDNIMSLSTPIAIRNTRTGELRRISTKVFAAVHADLGRAGSQWESYETCDETYRYTLDIPPDELAPGQQQYFVNDVEEAVSSGEEWKGPSWPFFAYACEMQRPVSIVTARGHSRETIRAGVRKLVDMKVLSCEPNYHTIFPVTNEAIWRSELQEASAESPTPTGRSGIEPPIPTRKRSAIVRSVDLAVEKWGADAELRFGMSDDDPANISLITRAMAECKERHRTMRFFVISTHAGEHVKLEVFPPDMPVTGWPEGVLSSIADDPARPGW